MASVSRVSFLTGVGLLLLPGLAVAQSSEPPPSEASPSSTAPASTAPGTASTSTTTTTTSSASPTSASTEREAPVNPSSIGASAAPVPAQTAGERAAAHASEPGYAQANHPHEEDNGRSVDFIFIQAEGGLSVIDLTGLSTSGARVLPTLHETRQTGYGGGLTVGFRSWIFAIAAHGYISRFISGTSSSVTGVTNDQSFDFGQLMLEGQIRIPLPVIEPYIRVGFGYAFLGAFQLNAMYQDSTSDINGWTGKVGAGIDVWLGHYITIGAGADFSVMNLRRGGVMRDGSACPTTDPTCVELRMDGDALGWLIAAHVQAGLHF